MSEAQSFDWQPVDEDDRLHRDPVPRLSIYSDGSGRINAAADAEWFVDYDGFKRYADRTRGAIAFEPTDGDDVRVISRDEGKGGTVALKKALRRVGVDVDALDDSHRIELDAIDGMVVADVSRLVEQPIAATRTGDRALDATTQAATDTDDADDESTGTGAETTVRSFIEKRVANAPDDRYEFTALDIANELDMDGRTVGAKLRALRNDDDALVEVHVIDHNDDNTATYRARPRGTVDDPSLEEVRDLVDEVDSVQELADELAVSEGQARRVAMDAEIYEQIDDDISPMGWSG